ncbi:MAG: bifunctional phosphoglucose/phosphomannose isomerase [Candidatus Omnitrophota bacterium]
MNLDDPKNITRYDRAGMLETIELLPQQCLVASSIGSKIDLPRRFKSGYKNIVCAGMGGSAIGADIARSYLFDKARAPLFVNRNYTVPGFVGRGSLIIASSYSGNTEETISSYKDAKAKKADIIVITSGGKLKKMAEADGFPAVIIPGGLPPRCAIGYSFFPLLILLSKIGFAGSQEKDISETIKVLSRLKERLGHAVPESVNPAKKIAGKLYLKYPVIYAGQEHIDCAATRWRGELAENSKTVSSVHTFPEMCHNEIVGWANPERILKSFAVILLRDKGDSPRIGLRMDIVKRMLKTEGIEATEVHSSGDGLLARIFSLIYMGDFASFYLAIMNRTDPTPVDRITYLKKELSKKG